MKSLSFAYLVSLLVAFTVVGGVSSLLYELNIGDYRFLSSMFGRAEFDFGEYQARLLIYQAVFFIPLSVIVGLPGMYLLHRHHCTATRYFASLGAGLGLVVGVPLWLSEMKPSWGLLSLMLGVVWAFVYQRWTASQKILAMSTDAYTWARRATLAVGVFELIGVVLWCLVAIPFAAVDAKVGAFLFVGPLSVLPASILACYRPRWGGLWLIVGGVLSGYLIMFSIPHPNLRGGLHFEALVPLLLVSVPMLILGAWLLVVRKRL